MRVGVRVNGLDRARSQGWGGADAPLPPHAAAPASKERAGKKGASPFSLISPRPPFPSTLVHQSRVPSLRGGPSPLGQQTQPPPGCNGADRGRCGVSRAGRLTNPHGVASATNLTSRGEDGGVRGCLSHSLPQPHGRTLAEPGIRGDPANSTSGSPIARQAHGERLPDSKGLGARAAARVKEGSGPSPWGPAPVQTPLKRGHTSTSFAALLKAP